MLAVALLVVPPLHPLPPTYAAYADKTKGHKQFNLTIGYLTAMKGELRDKQGLAISGALSLALDEVKIIFK